MTPRQVWYEAGPGGNQTVKPTRAASRCKKKHIEKLEGLSFQGIWSQGMKMLSIGRKERWKESGPVERSWRGNPKPWSPPGLQQELKLSAKGLPTMEY